MSSGVIRDFAGPYFVSEDHMGFGRPTKYWKLDPSKVKGGAAAWDRSVVESSEEYKGRMVKFKYTFTLFRSQFYFKLKLMF